MKTGDLLNPEQYVLEILEGIEVVEGNLPEDGNDVEEALAFAKRAVAKQIAKKPVPVEPPFMDYMKCPSCGESFDSDEQYNLECGERHYCANCGQKLEWGD